MSSLRMNFYKSNLIVINLKEGFFDSASLFPSCSIASIPFRFVGIPVGANPKGAVRGGGWWSQLEQDYLPGRGVTCLWEVESLSSTLY